MAGPRIPQVDPGLLEMLARAKGAAAAAPLKALGGIAGEVGRAMQKRKLEKQQATQKEEEKDWKFSKFVVDVMSKGGQLEPVAKAMAGGQPQGMQLPTGISERAGFPGGATVRFPAARAKKGMTILTGSSIKRLEDKGLTEPGFLTPNMQIPTSEYLKLIRGQKKDAKESFITLPQEEITRLENEGKIGKGVITPDTQVKLSTYNSIAKGSIKDASQALLEQKRGLEIDAKKIDIALKNSSEAFKQWQDKNITETQYLKRTKQNYEFMKELAEKHGLPVPTAEPTNPVVKQNWIKSAIASLKSVFGFPGTIAKGVSGLTKPKKAAKAPAGFVEAVDAKGNRAYIKKDAKGKIIEVREIK